VVDVGDVASVADCVDECDRHQSCLAVDVNETLSSSHGLISCLFHLASARDSGSTLARAPAPGVVQFVAERCPEDGTAHCDIV